MHIDPFRKKKSRMKVGGLGGQEGEEIENEVLSGGLE
jgi:hypothetical protein